MNYNLTGKVNKKFILDDSEVTETVNIIENLLDEKLEVEIKDQDQLREPLDNPSKLIYDEKLIEKVKKFKKMIIKKSTTYYVESK